MNTEPEDQPATSQEEIAAKIATSLDATHSWASRRDIIAASLRKPATSRDHQAASETPRTDAKLVELKQDHVDMWHVKFPDFARQLERDLATSQRLVEELDDEVKRSNSSEAIFEAQLKQEEEDFRSAAKERDELKATVEAQKTTLDELGEYLWPNQTGLPNEFRDPTIAVKMRETLLRKQVEALTKELSVAKSVAETNVANWLKACEDIAEITKERDEASKAYQSQFNALTLSHRSYIDDLMQILGTVPFQDSLTDKARELVKSCEDLKAHLAAANKGAKTNAKINASLVAQLHDLKAANAVLEKAVNGIRLVPLGDLTILQ